MKKRIGVLLIVVLCLFSITGCGNSGNNESAKANNYDSDFDSLLNDINKLYEDSNYVASVVCTEWGGIGPKSVASYLEWTYELGCGQFSDYDIEKVLQKHLGYDYETVCKTYALEYDEIKSLDSTIFTKLQTFKSDYGTDHQAAVDALTSYYVEASSYGDAAINPSGNYVNYSDSVSEHKSNCDSLLRAAQLAK